MLKHVIKISKISALSPVVSDSEVAGQLLPVSRITQESEEKLAALTSDKPEYKKLDRAVQMALVAGRELLDTGAAGLLKDKNLLVNVGSSRGATSIFEKAHTDYLNKGSVPVMTSPATTLGNISSWLMQDLKLKGMTLSTSVTCSTALQAVCNSYAWLSSGLADFAVAGASEAPLTGFTIAQMQALRIYAQAGLKHPCMPCALEYEKGAGMVLGEGAVLFLLEKKEISDLKEDDVYIESFGYASEALTSATSISADAKCIFDAMSMAIKNSPAMPEIVLLHAPGTEQGDKAEIAAVENLYKGKDAPVMASNKWMIGHTFGAAGGFNLEYAVQILKNQKYIDYPYKTKFNNPKTDKISRVMLNAAGFGGNAVSMIVGIY